MSAPEGSSASGADDILNATWAARLTPLDVREIWEWIAQEGELPTAYAFPGRFDSELVPFVRPVLQALRNAIVREVTAMAGVQCLKTLIGEMWLLWSIVESPGPTQWLQPTDEEAKEHCQERFLALMANYPIVHRLYSPNRHDRTTAFIRFLHMYLRMEGAESKGNLQRKSIKNQMRSEVWQADKWKPGKLREAASRQTQFVHNSKAYTESQAGWVSKDEDGQVIGDDLYLHYLAGTQNVWQFQCLACGRYQPYLWSHLRPDGTRAAMRWEDSSRTRRPNGQWRWAELVQTVRYECIHCGHAHPDDPLTRRRMSASSQFVSANPDASPAHQSFTWNQIAVQNLSWFETKIGGVKNFLLAQEQHKKGFEVPLREFFQKVMAEPWDAEKRAHFVRLPTLEIATEASADKIEHAGVVFEHRFLTVDVQADHLWFLVSAWAKTGEFLLLDAGKLYNWADLREKQLARKVPDQDVLVDCAHRQAEVWSQCVLHGHVEKVDGREFWLCWKALRGSDEKSFVWFPKKGRDKGRRIPLPYSWPPQMGDPSLGMHKDDERRHQVRGRFCPVITWSNPTVKDVAKNLRDFLARGTRAWMLPGEWNEDFSKHLYSETKRPVTNKLGHVTWKWEVLGRRPNHLWDCFCMAVARAFMLRILGEQAQAEPGPNSGVPVGTEETA